jgi:ketosteroid isomerase-like protein
MAFGSRSRVGDRGHKSARLNSRSRGLDDEGACSVRQKGFRAAKSVPDLDSAHEPHAPSNRPLEIDIRGRGAQTCAACDRAGAWERARTSGTSSRPCTAKKDWDGAASLFAADAVHIDPTGRHEGREAIRARCEQRGEALSDISFPSSLLIEQGDAIVAEYTFRALHTGALPMPDGTLIPPSGNVHVIPCVTISELRDGKFAAICDYFDLMTGLSQLGLLPGT